MFNGRPVTSFFVVVWCIVPAVVLLMLSFSASWRFPLVLPASFTARHWKDFFAGNSSDLPASCLVSLFIAAFVGGLATILGFGCSRWIASHRRKNLLLFIAYFPFVLSPVIFAVCLKYFFLRAGLAGNLAGVIFAQLIIVFPYSTIFLVSFWNKTIGDYVAVASTLGSGPAYINRHVLLPAAKSFLLTCFFQCFMISWFEYGLTSVIGYGKVQTLTIKVFQFIGEANTYYAALSSCLLILPPVLLLWFNKKFVLQAAR